jgi:hypothetical protein
VPRKVTGTFPGEAHRESGFHDAVRGSPDAGSRRGEGRKPPPSSGARPQSGQSPRAGGARRRATWELNWPTAARTSSEQTVRRVGLRRVRRVGLREMMNAEGRIDFGGALLSIIIRNSSSVPRTCILRIFPNRPPGNHCHGVCDWSSSAVALGLGLSRRRPLSQTPNLACRAQHRVPLRAAKRAVPKSCDGHCGTGSAKQWRTVSERIGFAKEVGRHVYHGLPRAPPASPLLLTDRGLPCILLHSWRIRGLFWFEETARLPRARVLFRSASGEGARPGRSSYTEAGGQGPKRGDFPIRLLLLPPRSRLALWKGLRE